MRKFIILLLTIFLLNVFVVYATEITIGSAATDRVNSGNYNRTFVDRTNPANASGKITKVEIWANENMSGVEVATFYVVSGNNLSTRDYESIGSVTAGAKRTFDVDLDVVEGDYIGIYFTEGQIERDSQTDGSWWLSGDYIPCSNTTFTSGNYVYSLHGIGTTGWGGKFDTVTIGKWNEAEIQKWNTVE